MPSILYYSQFLTEFKACQTLEEINYRWCTNLGINRYPVCHIFLPKDTDLITTVYNTGGKFILHLSLIFRHLHFTSAFSVMVVYIFLDYILEANTFYTNDLI